MGLEGGPVKKVCDLEDLANSFSVSCVKPLDVQLDARLDKHCLCNILQELNPLLRGIDVIQDACVRVVSASGFASVGLRTCPPDMQATESIATSYSGMKKAMVSANMEFAGHVR